MLSSPMSSAKIEPYTILEYPEIIFFNRLDGAVIELSLINSGLGYKFKICTNSSRELNSEGLKF